MEKKGDVGQDKIDHCNECVGGNGYVEDLRLRHEGDTISS